MLDLPRVKNLFSLVLHCHFTTIYLFSSIFRKISNLTVFRKLQPCRLYPLADAVAPSWPWQCLLLGQPLLGQIDGSWVEQSWHHWDFPPPLRQRTGRALIWEMERWMRNGGGWEMMRWQKRGKIHKTSRMTCQKIWHVHILWYWESDLDPEWSSTSPLNGESQIYKYDTVEILARKHS